MQQFHKSHHMGNLTLLINSSILYFDNGSENYISIYG